MWEIWAIVAVVLVIIEITTTSFFTIYFGVAAALVAVLALIGIGLPLQVGLFAALGTLGVVTTRPRLVRLVSGRQPDLRIGVDAMQGRIGVLTRAVSEFEPGLLRVEGETWTARSYYEHETIPEGSRVEVVEIRGVTALVIPAPAPPHALAPLKE